MITNYLKIAWRNQVNNPFYSIVNIIGLAIGIAFTLLMTSYIWSEWNVNRTLKNADRQYIIQSKWKDPNLGIELTTFGPLAKALHEQFPDLVKNYYRWDGITSNVSKGDKAFREGLQVCDSTMLEMYGFDLLSGDPKTAFNGPYSLIITDEKAIKYFNKLDVLGESLSIENFSGAKHDFIITGVMKKQNLNSVTRINADNENQFYISSANLNYFGRNMEVWQNQYIPSYIELQPGITPTQLQSPIDQLVKLYVSPALAANVTTYIMPLHEFYLSSFNGTVKKLIYALSAIAFFILLMAVVNFINLSVSRSATRLREIGIRKVMGGLKNQLIFQFLIEALLITTIATFIAIVLSELMRPLFASIISKDIPSLVSLPFEFIGILILFVIFIGLLAGIYPAFILSSLQSIDALKGTLKNIGDKVLFRKLLVGFQFATASVVFIGAIMISTQVDYFFKKDLGFDKEYLLSAPLPRDWSIQGIQRMHDFRDHFAMLPTIRDVSLSYEVLDGNNSGNISLYRADRDSTSAVNSQLLITDSHFASTYGITMNDGYFYFKEISISDSSKIVINETQAKALGWINNNDALGRQLRVIGNNLTLSVAGVTKDFHFGSFNKSIQPITFMQVSLNPIYRYFSFKLKPGDLSQSLADIQNKWNALMPGTPFEYKFIDEKIRQLYLTELQLKKASLVATFLSVIIVFLGVLGLIGLSLQRRIKEIGIRKVVGSTVLGIIGLFIKEFLLILIVAGCVACPLAFLILKQWLNAYVYRIEITIWPFILSIGIIGILTTILICLQTFRVANSNPINSLRTE